MKRGDERIKKEIVDHLFWDDRVDAAQVKVEVQQGRVLVAGSVPSQLAMAAAIEDARSVAGVAHVESRLMVQPRGPEIDDDAVRADAELAVARSPELDETRIRVEVEDGAAVLRGSVDSFWKKALAEQVVALRAGVRALENRLAIVRTAQVEDQEIADQIRAAMERDAAADPEAVTIEVEGGIVTLTGRVSSWTERQAAWLTASHTAGVVDVRDQMAVAE